MKIRHIAVSVALALPVVANAIPEGFGTEDLKGMGVDTKPVPEDVKKAAQQEASETAILAAALGLPDKAFIPGKSRKARKIIVERKKKEARYETSPRKGGGLIDRKLVFSSGSSQLTPSAKRRVSRLADVYRQYPQIQNITVAGHTDTVGDDSANMRLSQSRADSVKRVLIDLGVPAKIIVAKGYGETRLLPNLQGVAAAHRRVELDVKLPSPKK